MSTETKKEYRTLIPLVDELRGDRITLRPYREEDAEALREAVDESREHIRPWLPFADEHKTVEDSREWINGQRAKWIMRETMNMAIWENKPGGRYLGGIGLHPHNWDIRHFEIGYWLRKSAEGQGYMAEAVQLITDYALNELKANRVEILCDELNTRSGAVAKRLGFTQEALLRNDYSYPTGTVRNTLVFSRIPSDPPTTDPRPLTPDT